MSILRELLKIKPLKNPLQFGVQENIRLVRISNEEKIKDGAPISRNTYMSFAQFDASNNKVAETEFSYFNLDHTSDFVLQNLATQVAQLNNLVDVLVNSNPNITTKITVDPFQNMPEVTTADDIKKVLRTAEGCKSLMKNMWESFSNAVSSVVGENSPLLRIKIVTDTNGKFLQLPKDATFVELMSEEPTKLSITAYELKNRNKAGNSTTVTPENGGENSTEAKKPSILNTI